MPKQSQDEASSKVKSSPTELVTKFLQENNLQLDIPPLKVRTIDNGRGFIVESGEGIIVRTKGDKNGS